MHLRELRLFLSLCFGWDCRLVGSHGVLKHRNSWRHIQAKRPAHKWQRDSMPPGRYFTNKNYDQGYGLTPRQTTTNCQSNQAA